MLAARNNLANVLLLQGATADAADAYREVLRLRPNSAEAHNNLGVALLNFGQTNEACNCFRKAVQLKPDYAAAHNNLGDVLGKLGRTSEALHSFRQAVAAQPQFVPALINLSKTLMECKQYAEAETVLRQALQTDAKCPDVWVELGLLMWKQAKFSQSEEYYREAIKMDNGNALAWGGLGLSLKSLEQFDEAYKCYDRAVSLDPQLATVFHNRAQISMIRGNWDDALEDYRLALQIDPNNAEIHIGKATALLSTGKLQEGFQEYEWRWKCSWSPPFKFSQPRWDGSSPQGKTILLKGEFGLGDTIQFLRYAPEINKLGARVVVMCAEPLVSIATTCPGVAQVVANDGPVDFDAYVPMFSLPILMQTTIETIPAPIPYVTAAPERVAHWRDVLQEYSGKKVGIVWQGNPRHKGDKQRSIPLQKFAPLAGVADAQLFSLQKGHGSEQMDNLPEPFPIVDMIGLQKEGSDSFMDTAAILKNLDLLISCDTSILHLAGALGVPAWGLLAHLPDWRWCIEKEKSPWYPTVRLFRQSKRGDWDEVFERVALALREQSEK